MGHRGCSQEAIPDDAGTKSIRQDTPAKEVLRRPLCIPLVRVISVFYTCLYVFYFTFWRIVAQESPKLRPNPPGDRVSAIAVPYVFPSLGCLRKRYRAFMILHSRQRHGEEQHETQAEKTQASR